MANEDVMKLSPSERMKLGRSQETAAKAEQALINQRADALRHEIESTKKGLADLKYQKFITDEAIKLIADEQKKAA